MTNNAQDLIDDLNWIGDTDAETYEHVLEDVVHPTVKKAAELIEKLAALPDELNEIEWVTITGEAPCDCANRIDQIFTEVLGNDNTR